MSEILVKEARIQLRDELIECFLNSSVMFLNSFNKYVIIKSKLNKILKNNSEIQEKYNLYINQFTTIEEAHYCIRNKCDPTDFPCPICGKPRKYHKRKNTSMYYKTCGDTKCSHKNASSRESREKAKNTSIERHGIDNFNNIKQAQQTCLKKYGKKNPFQVEEFKEKGKQTNIDKLGVPYPMQSEEIQEKSKLTCLEKYGKEYYMQTDEFKEISKQKSLENYGTENPSKSDEIKEKISLIKTMNNILHDPITNKDIADVILEMNKVFNKIIQIGELYDNGLYFTKLIELLYNKKNRLLKLYEIGNLFQFSDTTIKSKVKKLNLLKYFNIQDSNLELQFTELLNYKNINFERHNKNILLKTNDKGQPELDFYLKDYNIAFEINDVNTHNSKVKDQFYHLNKTLQCKEKNIKLIHLWGWEMNNSLWPNISDWILNLLNKNKININFNDCIIKQIKLEEEIKFENTYNLYGYNQSYCCYGLYYNNELVQLISFSQLYDDQYEILRFCTKFGYEINNGLKCLLNYFISTHSHISVIASVDLSKFTGKTFEENGFKLIKNKCPSLISYNKNESSDYKKIYDCGKNIYILKQ